MKNYKYFIQLNQKNDEITINIVVDDTCENVSKKSSTELQIGDIFLTKEGDKIVENWVMN